MESRWYLFEGQTLDNTKIDDREHALHITSTAWKNITKHLDRKRLIQESIDKEKEHRKALKEGSEAMTRNWDNSIENIRRRKEEGREQRLGIKDVDRLRTFYEMRGEQEAQREEHVRRVRRDAFLAKGACRDASAALVEAEVLHERERQLEFARMIRAHQLQEDREYAEKVRAGAEAERRENEEKERKATEEKRALGEMLMKEIKGMELKKKAEKERIAKREQEDFEQAAKELEEKNKIEAAAKAERKAHLKESQSVAFKRAIEKKKTVEKEEKEMDEVIALYAETKHRIDCMKKQKEDELQHAQTQKMLAIAKLATADQENRANVEKAFLEKAQAEKLAEEQEILERKLALQEQIKNERIQDRKQYLERKEHEILGENEVKKWEMLNRYKTDEVYKEYDKERKSQHWQKVLQYRKDLLEQIEDDKNIQKAEAEEERLEYEHEMKNFKKEDEMFFQYADEVIDEAAKKGRPTYPIQKVVLEYKKNNHLLPAKGVHCRHMCEKYTEKESKNTSKKAADDPKHMSLLKDGFLQCKCCKKYFK